MFTEYSDILGKIAEPPRWWDENRVPRYVDFAPQYIADIYSDEAALIEIACFGCLTIYKLACSMLHFEAGERAGLPVAEAIRRGDLLMSDPPNPGCCLACWNIGPGATRNTTGRGTRASRSIFLKRRRGAERANSSYAADTDRPSCSCTEGDGGLRSHRGAVFGRHPERSEGPLFDCGPGKKSKSKRDPSSQEALLWMTAKCGLAMRWQ